MTIERLGLRAGEAVRFRRADRTRWQDGTAVGLERDGSLSVRDTNGASRAVPLDAVLVRASGRRGGRHWEPLLDRARRTEQLDLFSGLAADGVNGAGARAADRRERRRRAPRSGDATR